MATAANASSPPTRLPPATAWLELPDGAERSALRAGLIAMGVTPGALPTAAAERGRAWSNFAADVRSVAFVDITVASAAPVPHLLRLQRALPDAAARGRTFLTRLAGSHGHESERRWVQGLGFADLLVEFDPRQRKGALESLLDRVAALLGRPRMDRSQLERYLRAMEAPARAASPRALIRRHTGLSAEALAAQLERLLDVRDRRWRLKDYAQCFVGREAVSTIAKLFDCARDDAVAVGRALGEMGLVSHVMHEHEFADEELFFRLAWSEVLDAMDLGRMHQTLLNPKRVPVADRSWRGRSYPQCWVGEEAVNALAGGHSLSRIQATLALQRLMQLGLFEHVVREQPFIDGEFFYRHLGAA